MKIFGKELKLFNYSLEGKGVKKEPVGPKNLKNFFKYFANNFTRLVTVNIYCVLGNFPILFALFAFSGNLNRDSFAPAYKLFAPIYGLMQHETSPITMALHGLYGTQTEISWPTTATYVVLALSALVIFTYGYVNVGTTYILRNIVKGEPIFMWEDFKYAIRRNRKQGMIMGILDLLFSVLVVYDIVFFYYNTGVSSVLNFMFWASLLLAALWFWMRFYVYILMVTFDLSIFKLLKNSLIFSVLGFKRNFMATLGIAAVIAITFIVTMYALPIGILIPFICAFGIGAFMSCYAAFPKIKEIMIDPYYTETKPEEYEEPIFHDLG